MTIDGANPAVCKIGFEEVSFSLIFCLILETSHHEFHLKNTYIAYIAVDIAYIGFIIDISNKRHYTNFWCQRKCFVLFQFLFHFFIKFLVLLLLFFHD